MKTLGLIGGTSWLSTIDYYRAINRRINERLGGLNAARILLYSVNFEEFRPPDDPSKWQPVTQKLCVIANKLVNAGAECILLCANTTHLVADEVQRSVSVPLIHIAEATAKEIKKKGMNKVGLLGTKLTMEQKFFKNKLKEQGIEAVIPVESDREYIHDTIFNELGRDIFKKETKEKYLEIISDMKKQGIQGVIFACTEIPILIKAAESPVPVFDTVLIHAEAAVEFALGDIDNRIFIS